MPCHTSLWDALPLDAKGRPKTACCAVVAEKWQTTSGALGIQFVLHSTCLSAKSYCVHLGCTRNNKDTQPHADHSLEEETGINNKDNN